MRVQVKYYDEKNELWAYDELSVKPEEVAVMASSSHIVFKFHHSAGSFTWTKGKIETSTFLNTKPDSSLLIEVSNIDRFPDVNLM